MRRVSFSEIEGKAEAPPSKSVMQRAVAAASLCRGESRLERPARCRDAEAALGIAEGLGATILREANALRIVGNPRLQREAFQAEESGTAFRLFAPILAGFPRATRLEASGSLRRRPMSMLEPPLRALGALANTENGYAPLVLRGPLKGGYAHVDGSVSSQHLSGLLMAAPLAREDVRLHVSDLRSRPYVELTLEIMKRFGILVESDFDTGTFRVPTGRDYRPCRLVVEGDWSGAAFLLTMGALCGDVCVEGLNLQSLQADRLVLEALIESGASVHVGPDSIRVMQNRLKSFDFDLNHCPDLFPPLAALAGGCEGTSRLFGLNRLQHKECDRAAAIIETLSAAGIRTERLGDQLRIRGGAIGGFVSDPRNDHRIAMMAALLGLRSRRGVSIRNPDCVEKSFPNFFHQLKSLGGRVA